MSFSSEDIRSKKLVARYGNDSEIDDVRLDELTASLLIIESDHHEIHDGHSFHVNTTDTTMADTDTIILAFKTPPAPKYLHILYKISIKVSGHLTIYEGATWDQGTGSAETIFNRKRSSSIHSGVLENRQQVPFIAHDQMILNPSNLGTGSATTLEDDYYFGANIQPTITKRSQDEWILLPDTQYAYVLTAIGNSNAGQLNLIWYEHTDLH